MKWIVGKVVEQKQWAPGLFSLYFEAPLINFIPGQFVQVCFDTQLKLFRPYSLLNAPHDSRYEIYFTLVKEGHLTPQLASLAKDETIWISEKAHGRFVLDEIDNADTLWCFATGTGIGPYLSILKTSIPWQKFKKIVLIHSVRYSNELTHQNVIQSFATQFANQFVSISVVTREKTLNTLNERIPLLLESNVLENHVGSKISAHNSQVMLCGNPAMVNDVTQYLTQRGLKVNHHNDKGHITTENYWKNPMN